MRVVELSNHPGDMLDHAARRRLGAERHLLSVYEDELVRYRARVQVAKVEKDRARAGHRWWAWLRLSVTAWRVKHTIPRPPVPAAGHAPYGRSDLEEKIMAGSPARTWWPPSSDGSSGTAGRCSAATATGAARSTTCSSARGGCSRSR